LGCIHFDAKASTFFCLTVKTEPATTREFSCADGAQGFGCPMLLPIIINCSLHHAQQQRFLAAKPSVLVQTGNTGCAQVLI
jgi:hypothetical protein